MSKSAGWVANSADPDQILHFTLFVRHNQSSRQEVDIHILFFLFLHESIHSRYLLQLPCGKQCWPWSTPAFYTVCRVITIAQDKTQYIHTIFFLFLHENNCCKYSLKAPQIFWGYTLEVHHQGTSNEYHKICFCWEIRTISVFYSWKMCFFWRVGKTLQTCREIMVVHSGSVEFVFSMSYQRCVLNTVYYILGTVSKD